MSEDIKKFNYTVGIYDVICRAIRIKIEEQAKEDGAYGIGVFTDRYCEEELMTKPMKNQEERMQIVKAIKCFEININSKMY